ncbi:MAG: AAA family ATPase [Bacteroidota bacterium]
MKILKIGLKNLNSLRLETTIDFTASPLSDVGLFAIVGDTGAGKTTILDAMTLGLYGSIHRNAAEGEVLSYGTVDGYAEVEFLAKEKQYRAKWTIHRARGKLDGNLITKRELSAWNPTKKVFEILATKIREIERQVEEITGLDYDRFKKSVLLSQGDFAAFLKADDKERSNLLERITGTEIYSKLSKAAFEKNKVEQERVNALKLALENLQILDEETLQNLQQQRKDLAKDSEKITDNLASVQRQIEWRKRLASIATSKATFEAEVRLANLAISEAATDFETLKKHQSTLVFQKELTQLEGLKGEEIRLEKALSQTSQLVEALTRKQSLLSTETVAATEALANLKKRGKAQEKVFQQVQKLDVQIADQIQRFEEVEVTFEEIKVEVSDNQLFIERKEAELLQLKTDIANGEKWLADKKAAQKLEGLLPSLTNFFADWSSVRGELTSLQKQKLGAEAQYQKEKSKTENAEQQLETAQQQYDKNLTRFYAHFEDKKTDDRNQLLNRLSIEIAQLDEQSKNLKTLFTLDNEYKKGLDSLSKFDEEADNLRKELFDIENDLLSAVELEAQLATTFDYKSSVYEQQKLFADLQKEREKLKEGEPCPLCLSTSHPFRKMENLTPFVNEAATEFESTKLRLEQQKNIVKQLLFDQQQTAEQIKQIQGDKEKEREGKRDLILQQIVEQERQIAEILPELNDKSLYSARADALEQKLKVVASSISNRKQLHADLLVLNETITELERTITRLNNDLNQARLSLSVVENSVKNTVEKITENETKETALQQKISGSLLDFDLSVETETPTHLLATLNQKKADYDRISIGVQEKRSAALLAEQNLQQAIKNRQDLEKRRAKIGKTVAALDEKLSALRNERQVLFGDQVVATVKANWQQQLETAETTLATTTQALKDAEIQLNSELTKAQTNEKDLMKIRERLNQLTADLQVKIQQKGFANIEALKAAHLEATVAEQLTTNKNRLEKRLTQAQQSLTNALKDEKNTISQALTTDSLPTLEAQQVEYQQQLQDLNQQIGRLTKQMEDNAEREAEGKTLNQQLTKQEKEHRRWAKLKDLIGSSEGKVFRAFAQGLTLKKLSELANYHLELLNGRYLIHKPNDKDLALEIIDTHHANNIRSIHTLSGGESFLVSLALALGLSDLAGRNTQIQSLFIDEGFGTLDENALDLAISTLENLQSVGKRIGVISHVSALKERIGTQIQVVKRGNGVSELRIAG